MKKLTAKWLKDNNACTEAVAQWKKEGCEPDLIKVLKRCIKLKHCDWGNWLIVRHMTYKQYVFYAVYAAEQVIDLYEKKFPDDKRLREAIDAAKTCIKYPSAENKEAAGAAAWAAGVAGVAAGVARVARVAWAAEGAAARAAGVAGAAWAAAWAAAEAAMQEKILRYGIGLLEAQHDGR